MDRFLRGEWLTLPQDTRANMPKLRSGENSLDVMAEQQGRGKAAQSHVERGQVSRARQELTGADSCTEDRWDSEGAARQETSRDDPGNSR